MIVERGIGLPSVFNGMHSGTLTVMSNLNSTAYNYRSDEARFDMCVLWWHGLLTVFKLTFDYDAGFIYHLIFGVDALSADPLPPRAWLPS